MSPLLANVLGIQYNSVLFSKKYLDESIALFARMDVQPTSSLKDLINTFIVSAKTKGYWDKLDDIVFCCLHTQQASLLNWKGNYTNGSAINAVSWTAKQGFTGATGEAVNTNFVPSTNGVNYTLNNAFYGGWWNGYASNGYAMGSWNNTVPSYNMMRPRSVTGYLQAAINQVASYGSAILTNGLGLTVVNRKSNALINNVRNGVVGPDTSKASTALELFSMYFMASNYNNGSINGPYAGIGSMYVIGGGFTNQNHTDLSTDVTYFINNVGGTF